MISRRFSKIARSLAALGAALAISACGTGDGPESVSDPVLEGRLLDSGVEGIGFRTASQSGITGPGGTYPYRVGETVEFFVGPISLGETMAQGIVTPVELVGAADPTEQAAIDLLVFLQSIDADGIHDNGIEVTASARSNAVGTSLEFGGANFATDVGAVVSQISGGANAVVPENEALDNFYDTYADIGGTDTVNFLFPGYPPVGAQRDFEIPLDFESVAVTYNITDFGGGSLQVIDNPDASGINTSTRVGQMVKDGGEVFGGAKLFLDLPIDFSDGQIITMKVWAQRAVPVLFQLEAEGRGFTGGNGNAPGVTVSHSGNGTWEELTFDFGTVNQDIFAGDVPEVVLIFDLGVVGDATNAPDDWIFYIDDILVGAGGGGGGGGGSEPIIAATTPTIAAGSVVSVFSGAYTDIAGVNVNPDWGQATVTTVESVAGNDTLKLAGLNFQGIDFAGNAQDLTAAGMDTLHIDFWTADASAVNLYLVSGDAAEAAYALPIVTGNWQSVDIPLSAFAGVDLADVIQFKFDDATTGEAATIFVDNLVFFDSAAGGGGGGGGGSEPVTAAPTPSEPAGSVASIFSDAYTDASGVNTNPDWGQATVTTVESVAGNNLLKMAGLNFQGIDFAGNAQDVSGSDTLHIDFWTPDATAVNLFLVSGDAAETAYALPITTGSWQSVDIPLSAFAGVDLTDVIQFKFDDNATGEAATIYVDNLYFFDSTAGGGGGGGGGTATVDFESGGFGAGFTWTTFENDDNPLPEIVANPAPDGVNGSATVASFTARAAGMPWAGTETAHGDVGPFLLDSSNSTVTIMVYKSVTSDVGVKLVTTSGGALVELKVANTLVNQWEELTFDFSAYVGVAVYASEEVDQIVVFPDFDLAGRAADTVNYFDNITLGGGSGGGGGGSEPNTAAPAPTADPGNVISIYSDAYTDVAGVNTNPDWGQATVTTVESIAGNDTLKLAGLTFQGIDFSGNPQDVSGMDMLHIDFWTPDATAVNLFLISTDAAETAFTLPIVTGSWQSVDIPLSAFAGVDLAAVMQFKFDDNVSGEAATIFVDNLYFFDSTGGSGGGGGGTATIDFEAGGFGAGFTWTTFENDDNPLPELVANPGPDGVNGSATVASFTARAAGMPWAGTETAHGDVGPFMLDNSNSTVTIMVYKSVISDVGVKLVTTSGGALVELKVANTLVNQWEELTFDFSAYVGVAVYASEEVDQIVVFPDFDLAGRAGDTVNYFDNITLGGGGSGGGGTEPTEAAPTPTADPGNVISIYSDAYTDVAGVNTNPDWGQATVTTVESIAGNDTLKLAGLTFQGIDFSGNPQDVSGMDMLHIDFWTPDATAVNLFLISTDAAETPFALPIATGSWQSVDIPLSAFAGVDLAAVMQFKFDDNVSGEAATIFVDNLYFFGSTAATEPSTAAPTPTTDPGDVISIYSDAYTNVTGVDTNPFWGQSTVTTVESIAGNDTLKLAGLNFQGIDFSGNPQDVSGMDMLHIDFWTPDATAVNLFLISTDAAETPFALPIATGSWQSVDIPLSAFAGVDLAAVMQFKFDDNVTGEAATIFVDNLYFFDSTGGGTGGGGGPSGTATIDFESGGFGTGFTWTVFENGDNPPLEFVANPAADGVNGSATVAKIIAREPAAGGMPWVGTETAHGDVGPYIIDASTRYVKIMVYKSVISDVGVKLVVENGAALPEVKVANTLVNQWEELTFDFEGLIGFGEYATMNIDQVVVFPDFDLAGRAGETTTYFDNISFSATP